MKISGKLLTDYLKRRELEIPACESALASGDFAFLRKTGHNLKGNGAMYGFPRISEIGKAIEAASITADRNELEKAIHQYRAFLNEVK